MLEYLNTLFHRELHQLPLISLDVCFTRLTSIHLYICIYIRNFYTSLDEHATIVIRDKDTLSPIHSLLQEQIF